MIQKNTMMIATTRHLSWTRTIGLENDVFYGNWPMSLRTHLLWMAWLTSLDNVQKSRTRLTLAVSASSEMWKLLLRDGSNFVRAWDFAPLPFYGNGLIFQF